MQVDSLAVPKREERSNPSTTMYLSESTASLEAELENLEQLKRTLGDGHKDTLSLLSKIATLSHRLGKHQDAIQYQMMVLMQLTPGPGEQDSQESLECESAVAFYEGEAGDQKAACKRAEEVLRKQIKLLGKTHIDTLVTQAKLLRTYLYLGRTDELLEGANKLIQICRDYECDPDTEIARELKDVDYKAKSAKAECLWTLGRNVEAFKFGKAALALCKQLSGLEHPDTLWETSLLSVYCSAKGDHEAALEQEENVLEACIRTMGSEHPVTINVKDHIALFHSHLGNKEEALRISKEVFQARRELFGEDHPDTLAAQGDMATYIANLGNIKEALIIEEIILEAYRRTVGEDHPEAIRHMGRIANNYYLVQMPDKALSYGEKALWLSMEVLGEKHPQTKGLKESVIIYQATAAAAQVNEDQDEVSIYGP
jgi:tetratricopeptide (TPR) repeat protein